MRVVVIGSGVAGLTAARRLVGAGHQAGALDKGRRPGGRSATRGLLGGTLAATGLGVGQSVHVHGLKPTGAGWAVSWGARHGGSAGSCIPGPGSVQMEGHHAWSWVADNVAKGGSRLPAVTFHTRPDGAAARFADDPGALTTDLTAAARSWPGAFLSGLAAARAVSGEAI